MLLSRAAALQPASPLVPLLREKIEERKRDQAIVERLNLARRAQQAGDLQDALRELNLGITDHPGDQRLIQAKHEVEQQLQQLEEQRARERQKARQLEAERERKREEESAREKRRQEALEQERIRAEQLQREQARARELELQREREKERERVEKEKRRVEEDRVQQEARRRKEVEDQLKRKAEQKDEPELASPRETRRFENASEQAHRSPSEMADHGPAGDSPAADMVSRLFRPDLRADADRKTEAPALTSLHNLGWQEEILHAMEKELAVHLGPLARIIVKKNARKTSDPEQLYKLLAESLEQDSERQAFLARKALLKKSWSAQKAQIVPEVTGTVTPTQPLAADLSPEALERAAHLIAVYVGPISKVLVRKEARQANNLRALYLRLAEHVEDPAARAQFLQAAGY